MAPEILSILGLLIFSAFFSGSESALFTLKWWQLHKFERRNTLLTRTLTGLMDKPRRLLVTILLGNTIVNVAASSIAEEYLERHLPGNGLWIAIIIMTIVLLIFGEITPKTVAISWAERVALAAALPLHVISIIFYPVRIVLEKAAHAASRLIGGQGPGVAEYGKERFIQLIRESKHQAILGANETYVAERLIRMDDMPVTAVMTPRTEILAIPVDITLRRAAEIFKLHRYRRVPVYRGSMDRIVGILYAKDLIQGWFHPHLKITVKSLARTPFFVPPSMSLKQLYHELLDRQLHLAIVLDEYGGTAGVVSMGDILNALLEPVAGSYPWRQGQVRRITRGYELDCRLALSQVTAATGVSLHSTTHHTLNGYLIDQFGRIPRSGDVITIPGALCAVIDASPRRINTVRLIPAVPHREEPL